MKNILVIAGILAVIPLSVQAEEADQNALITETVAEQDPVIHTDKVIINIENEAKVTVMDGKTKTTLADAEPLLISPTSQEEKVIIKKASDDLEREVN